MCLRSSTERVRAEDSFSEPFYIVEALKQGDAMSTIWFNLIREYVIRDMVQNKRRTRSNDAIQILGIFSKIIFKAYMSS